MAKNCPNCGRFIKTKDADLCWHCRENRKDPYIHTDDELAYHGGWIRPIPPPHYRYGGH